MYSIEELNFLHLFCIEAKVELWVNCNFLKSFRSFEKKKCILIFIHQIPYLVWDPDLLHMDSKYWYIQIP